MLFCHHYSCNLYSIIKKAWEPKNWLKNKGTLLRGAVINSYIAHAH